MIHKNRVDALYSHIVIKFKVKVPARSFSFFMLNNILSPLWGFYLQVNFVFHYLPSMLSFLNHMSSLFETDWSKALWLFPLVYASLISPLVLMVISMLGHWFCSLFLFLLSVFTVILFVWWLEFWLQFDSFFLQLVLVQYDAKQVLLTTFGMVLLLFIYMHFLVFMDPSWLVSLLLVCLLSSGLYLQFRLPI